MKSEFTYHVYNRCNGGEKMFIEERNYLFFLAKSKVYIAPVADIIAYCLMPNHFHFVLRIKSEEEIREAFPKFKDLEKFISKQFSKFFSCYTQSFNKVYKRKGSLFMKNFKRKEVLDSEYFANLIFYVHANPIHHGFTKSFSEWKWSSYKSFFNPKNQRSNTALRNEFSVDLEDLRHYHEVWLKLSLNFSKV